MGFFIVRPEYRDQGFGNTLWHARRQRLLDCLKPGAISFISYGNTLTVMPIWLHP